MTGLEIGLLIVVVVESCVLYFVLHVSGKAMREGSIVMRQANDLIVHLRAQVAQMEKDREDSSSTVH